MSGFQPRRLIIASAAVGCKGLFGCGLPRLPARAIEQSNRRHNPERDART